MCGIAGLFLKDPALEPELGRLLAGMLDVLEARGPDSTGFAGYGAPEPGRLKYTLRGPAGTDFHAVAAALPGAAQVADLRAHDSAVIAVETAQKDAAEAWLAAHAPQLRIASVGTRLELYKGVGLPREVCDRFGLAGMAGTHAIGHTRMATESAVTTAGAHPFSTGIDQCLVHNGSLSNHNSIARILAREGFRMETANDSEVAAGYLSWRMAGGASLDQALRMALRDLDGFYTFVVGTESGFGVLRDSIACKPAVMAETDRYVAFGSEYRALVGLPGIEHAHLFEPEPERVYFWDLAQARVRAEAA
jgi:glutamate synthase domain-containing protein 1